MPRKTTAPKVGAKKASTKKVSQPRRRKSAADKIETRDPRLVEVGQRIKRVRLERSLEQKDLAELVDVTEKSVSNWEIGEHSPHRHLGALARALGVSETWLWQGQTEAPDQDQLVKLMERLLDSNRAIHDELRLIRLAVMDEQRRRLNEDIPM